MINFVVQVPDGQRREDSTAACDLGWGENQELSSAISMKSDLDASGDGGVDGSGVERKSRGVDEEVGDGTETMMEDEGGSWSLKSGCSASLSRVSVVEIAAGTPASHPSFPEPLPLEHAA